MFVCNFVYNFYTGVYRNKCLYFVSTTTHRTVLGLEASDQHRWNHLPFLGRATPAVSRCRRAAANLAGVGGGGPGGGRVALPLGQHAGPGGRHVRRASGVGGQVQDGGVWRS